MTTSTRVEIIGHYTMDAPFMADPTEEVRVDRQPQTQPQTQTQTAVATMNNPPNWTSFCDAADEALRPLTEGKKFYVTYGKVIRGTIFVSMALSVIIYFILDTAFFESIIYKLGLFAFFPFLTGLVSSFVYAVFALIFYFKLLRKAVGELEQVCAQYSSSGGGDDGGVRYEIVPEYKGHGRNRRLKTHFILVHFDQHHDVEQPTPGATTTAGGAAPPAGIVVSEPTTTGETFHVNPPTFEYQQFNNEEPISQLVGETGNTAGKNNSIFEQLNSR